MTRSDLIEKIAALHGQMTQQEVDAVVRIVFDSIADSLHHGERVELRGFGSFSVRERQARVGRNPRTGASVDVEAKRAVHFKPGKGMREGVDIA